MRAPLSSTRVLPRTSRSTHYRSLVRKCRSILGRMPAAPKVAFVCQSCGNQFPKWIGRCPNCGGWNTLVEERVVAAPKSRGSTRTRAPREPIPLDAVPPNAEERLSTGIGEFDRVLGGGVVRGSL